MSTAVVKSTECPFRQAARPKAIDKCVLPRPTFPIRTILVWLAMKARRNRFWICWRLIFLGQLHWKSSRVLSTGKRAFLMRRSTPKTRPTITLGKRTLADAREVVVKLQLLDLMIPKECGA